MVYQAVERNNPTDIDKKRIEFRLQHINDRLIKKSRDYNGVQSWIENALEQQNSAPFHAVITTQKLNIENVLEANEVDETLQLWNVPRQKRVPRIAQNLAQAVSSLLKIAEEIIFIDPYFDPGKRRFRRPLEQFLQEALHQNSNIKRIEYHVKVDFENEAERLTFGHNFDAACQNNIAPIIPDGFPVKFIRWKEREGGKRFHARYILTDRGGVLVENGLDDDDDDGGQVTPVVLLIFDMYSEIWNDFQKLVDLTQCTYEFDNEVTIWGTKRLNP